jgi:UDP-glucuronate 4-epimerase
MNYIAALEVALGIEAKKNFMPMQMGDVPATCSDTSELYNWVGFKPNTSIQDGINNFVSWYRDFYK